VYFCLLLDVYFLTHHYRTSLEVLDWYWISEAEQPVLMDQSDVILAASFDP